MPYLSHLNFDTVKTAIDQFLASTDPGADKFQLLIDAQKLVQAAHEGIASPGLRELAHELYGTDEIEIDDEGVGTAEGDKGIWVQAWVWVSHEQLVAQWLREEEEDVDAEESA